MNKNTYLILTVFAYISASEGNSDVFTLEKQRAKILDDEMKKSTGGRIVLNENETILNDILIKWKHEELEHSGGIDFSQNYFRYKDNIKSYKIYQLIRQMPKGALLHTHSTAMLRPDFFLRVTYREYLYICLDQVIRFQFSYVIPLKGCGSEWKLMRDLRDSSPDIEKFDVELRRNFTLDLDDVKLGYDAIWKRFRNVFVTIQSLWRHRYVFEDYLKEVLKAAVDDNVMYLEIRSVPKELHESDGTVYDTLFTLNLTKTIVDNFVKECPDFIGVKLIYAFNRYADSREIEKNLNLTKEAKRLYPDLIAGFDLVGQEDLGRPLRRFLSELFAAKNELDYFFHAGETDSYGTAVDENLIDAVLLGTKRIGHGNALLKHPALSREVIKKNICVEVNVVSNNVLGLTSNVKDHPLAHFIAQGFPVVLSSDDPGFWDADPLSTDFFVSFMGVASERHDLRLLKQLAINSLRCSSLSLKDKRKAFMKFNYKWKTFVNSFINITNSL